LRTGRSKVLLPAAVLFFGSGFAALVYQVAWQRILVLHTGIGITSVSLIVATFMAGLCLGNHAGGVWSGRLQPAEALRMFAIAELLVGAFATVSDRIYYDWLYLRGDWLFAEPWRGTAVHVAGLLPPTLLMGASLPFLVRALALEPGEAVSRVIGLLYAANVLGASAGALVTPWWLIRSYGVRGAIGFGAAVSLIVGGGALFLIRSVRREAVIPSAPTAGTDPSAGEGTNQRLWLLLYGLSGFCALSLELIWFRLTEVATKSSAFTFGTLLFVYLLGLGSGTAVGVLMAGRLRPPLRTFLSLQCAIAAYAAFAVALLARVPIVGTVLLSLFSYWGKYDEFVPGRHADTGLLLRLYALVPFSLYGVPTLLMGISFVALHRAVQDDPATSGRKTGALQAANIAGCVAGSLGVGLAGLNWLGTVGSLRAIVLVALVFAAVGLWRFGLRSRFSVLGASLLAAAVALPSPPLLWRRLHGLAGGPIVAREDATGLAVMAPDSRGNFWRLSVAGRGWSSLPFGWIHSQLGAVPALVHRDPRRIAIVGLGSGDTAWAASCRRETRATTVFEVVAPELPLLADMAALQPWADLHAFLADPRIQVRLEDARRALDREDAIYDVIEGDPLEPHDAYSGNLYSLEFFQRCASRLTRGGLMAAWSPTPRVRATVRTAFPHVLEFEDGVILLASNDPIQIDVAAWLSRLDGASSYLGPSITADVRSCLETVRPVAADEPMGDLNRDMWPRDEFLSR
jgi:spermidine synthase